MNHSTPSSFLGFFTRQRLIDRWQIMKNTEKETLLEHAAMTACVAHLLAEIAVKNGKPVNVQLVVLKALYHDCSEVILCDIASTTKAASPKLAEAYAELEDEANNTLVNSLPESLRQVIAPYFEHGDDYESMLLKAADLYCAKVKIMQELAAGNEAEYSDAYQKVIDAIYLKSKEVPELKELDEIFSGSITESLDKLMGAVHLDQ